MLVKNKENKKRIVVKRPYSTPKLVDYGSVSKITETKSAGPSDAADVHKHDVK
jgi:hypothetical protein